MSRIVIQGVGAVSPAGWQAAELVRAVRAGVPLPTQMLERPGQPNGVPIRRVPGNLPNQPWLRHPRLRRVSPIARFAASAAVEALGTDASRVASGELRLGIVYCVMAGCVNYSSRFYQEVLTDPATASPLVFPETVFNAPASHLAAMLGTSAISYTHVGDDSAFVSGLGTAAGWLVEGRVDACLVVGAEEADRLITDAMRLFDRSAVLAEGAGAVYLRTGESGIFVEGITDQHAYVSADARLKAARQVRAELETGGPADQIVLSAMGNDGRSRQEVDAWRNCAGSLVYPRELLGCAFNAASAWQVIVATETLRGGSAKRIFVPVTGCNQAAIGVSLSGL